MGPLVPDVISNELNLIVALLIGAAFGFILEQAGFSSSRKLTGLFYGTDFTVLRVFFTAGLTAMTGVLLLSKAGLLDDSVIYVNPTFLHSAIVGGAIMGIGFVLGGYCPGTSFCAAAVGRLDGLAFVAGGLAGVFVFGEAFPLVQGFFQRGSMGDVTVPALAGVSRGLFAVAMIVVAIAALSVTGRIERRVNPGAPVHLFPVRKHRWAAAALLAFGVLAATWPDSRERLLATAADQDYRRTHPVDRMTTDELAFRIADEDPSLLLIDARPDVANGWTLPGALKVTAADLLGPSAPVTLRQAHRRKVFFADGERQAEETAALAVLVGVQNVAVLQGGLAEFESSILDVSRADAQARGADAEVRSFRVEAGGRIAALIKAQASAKTAGRKPRKIVGGCGL